MDAHTYCLAVMAKICDIDVLLANIKPDTRCVSFTYGERRARATWIDAGPHGMNDASLRSRIRSRLLCT